MLFLIEIGILKLHYGSLGNVTNNRNKKAPVEVKLWRTRERGDAVKRLQAGQNTAVMSSKKRPFDKCAFPLLFNNV